MAESPCVGKDKLLLWDINVMYIVTIDYQALADTDKHIAVTDQLFGDKRLKLTELHRQDTAATVRLNKRRIIAVRGDIHHALRGNAHQVDRCGYDYVPSH